MQLNNTQLLRCIIFCCWVFLFGACTEERLLFMNRTSVRNPPVDTPFVYNNKIIVEGNISKEEKKRLTTDLENYWDDSLKARRLQQFGFFYKVQNPPVLDTVNISRTVVFMNSYLRAQGYYHARFKDSIQFSRYKNQIRATVTIHVNPGKTVLIDSIAFNIADTALQKLALQHIKKSFIKPGKSIFTKQLLADELDRLVSLYRQNGYFKLTRENLIAEVDTTNKALLQLNLNPFEQVKQIAAAIEQRKNNPTAEVIIKLRSPEDSTLNKNSLIPYYVGNIYYYPETKATELTDSLINGIYLKEEQRRSFTMRYREGKFVLQPLLEHTYMRKGNLYNEANYYRTLNNLGQIGAWTQVDSRPIVKEDTVNFHIFLYPAYKQNITFDLETSRNTGDFLSSNNLFGISLNTTYRNRNVSRRAIQSSTSLRNGIELSFINKKTSLQTIQSSISQTYSFPKLLTPFNIRRKRSLQDVRTIFNVNAAYADRKAFFRLRNLVTSWGYEWKKRNKVWQYHPLNIELYSLDTLQGLRDAFDKNPFLRVAFNTGSVVSQTFSFNVTYDNPNRPNQSNYIRIGIEESGSILGRIKEFRDEIYQYVKLEGEYRKLFTYKKTSLAYRAFAGVGINYSDEPKFGNTLPFFKQFIAGGPNSMRAWGLRQLGLGSSLTSDTTSSAFRDRFGDMQLETNLEYRYRITTIGSMLLGGALFADVGNVWNIRKNESNPNSEFSLNRLGKDIAIGVGTGIRLDFNYFLIRLDLGIKLKDPARLANNGWLDVRDFTWRNDEFVQKDQNGKIINPRNNYALQLGIGLPF